MLVHGGRRWFSALAPGITAVCRLIWTVESACSIRFSGEHSAFSGLKRSILGLQKGFCIFRTGLEKSWHGCCLPLFYSMRWWQSEQCSAGRSELMALPPPIACSYFLMCTFQMFEWNEFLPTWNSGNPAGIRVRPSCGKMRQKITYFCLTVFCRYGMLKTLCADSLKRKGFLTHETWPLLLCTDSHHCNISLYVDNGIGSRIIDPFYPNYFTHKAAVRDPCTDGSCFFFNWQHRKSML